MLNPVIFEVLSKVENQQRARQLAHIQQLNLAEKSREKKPSKIRFFKAQMANLAKRISIVGVAGSELSSFKPSVEKKPST